MLSCDTRLIHSVDICVVICRSNLTPLVKRLESFRRYYYLARSTRRLLCKGVVSKSPKQRQRSVIIPSSHGAFCASLMMMAWTHEVVPHLAKRTFAGPPSYVQLEVQHEAGKPEKLRCAGAVQHDPDDVKRPRLQGNPYL